MESLFTSLPLLEMSKWGGTDANSIKNGIDSIFSAEGTTALSDDAYKHKVIGCTSDGASVNFGRISGLMKRMANGRDWHISFQCVNHRVELGVKDAFKTWFNAVDQVFTGIYNLLKNSGKIKGEIKAAAKVWNITHYILPKITGTRFIGHRRNAFTRFVDMWPALISAFENVVADKKSTKATREKINTFLEKLKSYKLINLVCCYLDILDSITPASKIFEAEELLPYEVMPIVKETIANIDDILDDLSNEFSHVATFNIKGNQLTAMFKRGDDTRRKKEDREKHEISLEDIRELKKIICRNCR